MAIQAGDKMPSGSFGIMTADGPGSLSTDELFAGKKVVLFAVPGAFTPTCSKSHLPGFVSQADTILGKGVDTIACMSVNDAFVMHAWGKSAGADRILMLADGNGDFSRALGLEMDATAYGMGQRSQRFALIVANPPYVACDDPHLGRGDVRFEPALALRAGRDGLDAIQRIAGSARAHLLAGGALALEHGHDQGPAVHALLRQHGYHDLHGYRDLAGNDRVAVGFA